jgi:glycerol-3-phosphate acyltransferase PlsY
VTLALWIGVSYLLGAIPTSYLVARLARGIDLRHVGSKNLGATNLYRQLGWRYAIPVAAFDVAKGAIPVLVFGPRAGGGSWIAILLGLTAVVGHVFSAFVRFKGGKGVATAAGVVLGIAPLATLVSAVVWTVVVAVTGYVSLGSILAAIALPVAALALHPSIGDMLWLLIGLAGFVIVMHRANIKRLLGGTENRFGRRKAGST